MPVPPRHVALAASAVALIASCAAAQVGILHGWTAPPVDDGNPIPNFRNSWLTGLAGASASLASPFAERGVAADNANGMIYTASNTRFRAWAVDSSGAFAEVGSPVTLRNAAGVLAASNSQIASLGYQDGVLYASASMFWGNVNEQGLFAIDVATGVTTMRIPSSQLPLMGGMDVNDADGFLYGVTGFVGGVQSIIRVDPRTLASVTFATVPASAYNGVTGVGFIGLAAGAGKLFLTHALNSAYGNVPIAVFDVASGASLPGIPTPPRTAENRIYNGGATFFAPNPTSPCPADLDDSGQVDGADLGAMLAQWGRPGTGDLTRDGQVDGADLGQILASWGPCN